MKKFEAVSGDQILFDLVGASDDDLYIVKNGTTIFSSPHFFGGEKIIAERKPIEKYVPKVGDEYLSYGTKKKCIAVDRLGNTWGINGANVVCQDTTKTTEFTKIDRSPNPVNMVVSTQIPRVGERFKIDGEMDRTFKCSKISGGYVVTECGCDLAISLNDFNIVAEDKWVPKEGESFRVGGILYRESKYHNEGKIIGGYHEALGYKTQVYHPIETKFERP